MKREFEFIDEDKNLVRIECEIREGEHGDVFTMSGEYCGSMGQCLDSVHPKNKEQISIIEIWRRYHLNDMHAGTPKQEECLISSGINFHDYVNKGRKSVYDYECEVLERYGLLYDGEYKYGSGWIHQELPEDFECNLNDLIDKIEDIEENENERQVTEDDIDLFDSFREPEKALVLAIMNELCVNEIDQIDEASDNLWTVQGIDYLFGTDDEMDEEWDRELSNYLEECVYPTLPDNMVQYFDDESWKRDARYDGRGNALNRYDGGEESYCYNGEYYYAYRQ